MGGEEEAIVYLLTGKDSSGKCLKYNGAVACYRHETREEAARWRLGKHLDSSTRLPCLKDLQTRTAQIEVVSTRMPLKDAHLLEACHTVVNYLGDKASRGGPYCRRQLSSQDEQELSELAVVAEETSWKSRVAKLCKIVSSFEPSSSMRRHLENRCFRCGEKNWKTCSCRQRKAVQPPREAAVPVQSKPVVVKSIPMAVMKKSLPLLPLVEKSRSGKRPPMKRVRRVGLDPNKSRSGSRGKKESGASRLKRLKVPRNSKKWKRFKNGKEAAANVSQYNAKQYRKRVSKHNVKRRRQ